MMDDQKMGLRGRRGEDGEGHEGDRNRRIILYNDWRNHR